MVRKIKRRTTDENKLERAKSSADLFKPTRPTLVNDITPKNTYIVKLDCEDTKFMITFKNEAIVQCMSLDGKYETITIPREDFDKGIFQFTISSGGKCISKLTVYLKVK